MTSPERPSIACKNKNLLTDEVRLQIENLHDQTNPLTLWLQTDRLISRLLSLPSVGILRSSTEK